MTFTEFIASKTHENYFWFILVAISIIALCIGTLVLIVAFVRWELPLTDLRFIIAMGTLASIPYASYKMSMRNV